MVFQYINFHQVPWEVLNTVASGLGVQHLPRELANVNAWKTMFEPYNELFACCASKVYFTTKLLPTTFAGPFFPVPLSVEFGYSLLLKCLKWNV